MARDLLALLPASPRVQKRNLDQFENHNEIFVVGGRRRNLFDAGELDAQLCDLMNDFNQSRKAVTKTEKAGRRRGGRLQLLPCEHDDVPGNARASARAVIRES